LWTDKGHVMKKLPPIEELKRLFHYDPESGVLTWKIRTANRVRVGDEAGSLLNTGYKKVQTCRNSFQVHRICYAIYHGVDPCPMQIDHINHDRTDNRIDNLRLVTRQENNRNKSKQSNNTSGVSGVFWEKKRNKWRATVWLNGKFEHVGYFANKADAIAARRAAEKKYGFHDNHGDWDSQEPEPAPEVQLALFRPVAERPQKECRP